MGRGAVSCVTRRGPSALRHAARPRGIRVSNFAPGGGGAESSGTHTNVPRAFARRTAAFNAGALRAARDQITTTRCAVSSAAACTRRPSWPLLRRTEKPARVRSSSTCCASASPSEAWARTTIVISASVKNGRWGEQGIAQARLRISGRAPKAQARGAQKTNGGRRARRCCSGFASTSGGQRRFGVQNRRRCVDH